VRVGCCQGKPGTQQVVYRLHITTGGQAEQLRVSASSPDFPGQGES